MNRYSPLAAAMLLLASVMSYFVASNLNQQDRMFGGGDPSHNRAGLALADGDNTAIIKQACFDKYVMAPDGGRLDAIDGRGNTLVMKAFGEWFAAHPGEVAGYDAAKPALMQLDKLTDDQIRAIARSLDPWAAGA